MSHYFTGLRVKRKVHNLELYGGTIIGKAR